MSEFKSIKEVADELDVSVQAIYYKLNNMDSKFKREHSKKIKNKLVIDNYIIDVLKEIESLENNSNEIAESQMITEVEPLENNSKVFKELEQLEELKKQVEELKNQNNSKEIELTKFRTAEEFTKQQLEDKEKQISLNLEQLQNKDNQINSLLESTQNLEKLLKIEKDIVKSLLVISDTVSTDVPREPEQETTQNNHNNRPNTFNDAPQKKSFFDRIFKK